MDQHCREDGWRLYGRRINQWNTDKKKNMAVGALLQSVQYLVGVMESTEAPSWRDTFSFCCFLCSQRRCAWYLLPRPDIWRVGNGGHPLGNMQPTWKDKCLNESLGDEKHLMQPANKRMRERSRQPAPPPLSPSISLSDAHHFLFFHLAFL